MARPIRLAAAGDVHAEDANRDELARAFRGVDGEVDLVLLAGDLTTYGEPEQASILAEICRGIAVPVIAVLGNHDWHANRRDEVVEVLGALAVARPRAAVDVTCGGDTYDSIHSRIVARTAYGASRLRDLGPG